MFRIKIVLKQQLADQDSRLQLNLINLHPIRLRLLNQTGPLTDKIVLPAVESIFIRNSLILVRELFLEGFVEDRGPCIVHDDLVHEVVAGLHPVTNLLYELSYLLGILAALTEAVGINLLLNKNSRHVGGSRDVLKDVRPAGLHSLVNILEVDGRYIFL